MTTRRRPHVHLTFAVTRSQSQTNCVCCSKTGHRVWSCDRFRSGSAKQRWALPNENQLCFRCLSDRYLGKECPCTQVCGKTFARVITTGYLMKLSEEISKSETPKRKQTRIHAIMLIHHSNQFWI